YCTSGSLSGHCRRTLRLLGVVAAMLLEDAHLLGRGLGGFELGVKRAHPVDDLCGRKRCADEVSLRQIATHLAEHLPAISGFDAFGDYLHSQAVPQLDGRTHDHLIISLAFQIDDERLVDLDFIDWQPLELCE